MTQVLILAAGKSSRMGGDIPKPLLPIQGKPMILYLLETVSKLNLPNPPAIAVSSDSPLPSVLGKQFTYIVCEPKGTGFAVRESRNALAGKTDILLVLYSDQPFVRLETLQAIISQSEISNAAITMATLKLPNLEGENSYFKDFGRILRDNNGNLVGIKEVKDATDEEKQISEVNPSFFCFKDSFVWEALLKLEPKNIKQEYYLTDLVEIALHQGEKVKTIALQDPYEAIGINTPEQFEFAKTYALRR